MKKEGRLNQKSFSPAHGSCRAYEIPTNGEKQDGGADFVDGGSLGLDIGVDGVRHRVRDEVGLQDGLVGSAGVGLDCGLDQSVSPNHLLIKEAENLFRPRWLTT